MEKSPKKGSQEPFGKTVKFVTQFDNCSHFLVCEEGAGLCAMLLTVISMIMIVISLPLSLFFVVKVVQVRQPHNGSHNNSGNISNVMPHQEYERAVIFRLGRLLTGGARGPGVFFVIPCVDMYEKIDMRSQTFEIPPQEVRFYFLQLYNIILPYLRYTFTY